MEREITIELGDGDSAVMLTEMRHGTQRRIEEITRPALIYPETKIKVADGKVVKADVKSDEVGIDWSKADLTAVDDACILGQVINWTFGDKTATELRLNPGPAPVTREVLDSLPESKYKTLKAKVDEVFANVPLAGSGAGK
jgi:glycerophosphoryl diester phosphodiesterase